MTQDLLCALTTDATDVRDVIQRMILPAFRADPPYIISTLAQE